jgi:HAD superfamily hydrolase (TIGR01549 family)
MKPMIRAVLFDLDDTLFDHRHCARAALEALRTTHACFAAISATEFERTHGQLLDDLHARVLAGEIGLDDARVERFRRLFLAAGVEVSSDLARTAAAEYRRCYLRSWRTVEGAAPLLAALSERVPIGIVSNNLVAEQVEKIRHCGFEPYLKAIVISEEVGAAKPDPAIFRIAMERLSSDPRDTVMIGDSWPADIVGARAAGIRAIWFNRTSEAAPDPDAAIPELHSFSPIDDVLATILGASERTVRSVDDQPSTSERLRLTRL